MPSKTHTKSAIIEPETAGWVGGTMHANDEGVGNMKQQSPLHDTTGSRAERTVGNAQAPEGPMGLKTGKREASDRRESGPPFVPPATTKRRGIGAYWRIVDGIRVMTGSPCCSGLGAAMMGRDVQRRDSGMSCLRVGSGWCFLAGPVLPCQNVLDGIPLAGGPASYQWG